MNFPNKVLVTEQEIDLDILTEEQKSYYTLLAENLINLYSNNQSGRMIVSLSGPSGSGKSVTAKILEHLFLYADLNFKFYTLELDAFHFSNTYLEQASLINIKGRYDTYDTEKLNASLIKFKRGETITFPTYSRKTHNPVENGFTINEDKVLLFVVGLWFLRDQNEWEVIRKSIDYSLYVEGPQEMTKKNTIKRHLLGGKKIDEAKSFYDQSDLLNSDEISHNSIKPDEKIIYFENI